MQSGKTCGVTSLHLYLNSWGAVTKEGLSSQANQLITAITYTRHTCIIDNRRSIPATADPSSPTAGKAHQLGTNALTETSLGGIFHVWLLCPLAAPVAAEPAALGTPAPQDPNPTQKRPGWMGLPWAPTVESHACSPPMVPPDTNMCPDPCLHTWTV